MSHRCWYCKSDEANKATYIGQNIPFSSCFIMSLKTFILKEKVISHIETHIVLFVNCINFILDPFVCVYINCTFCFVFTVISPPSCKVLLVMIIWTHTIIKFCLIYLTGVSIFWVVSVNANILFLNFTNSSIGTNDFSFI